MNDFDPRAIGGSSAASCVGAGWESGLALWERLRGDDARAKAWTREQTRMLDAGKALEPVVARAVREDYGVELTLAGGDVIRHPKHPRIVAHVDGWIEPGTIGAEIKTTGGHRDGWGDADSDEVPPQYVAQCMHYMMLTGAPEWHLFALSTRSWSVTRYILRRDAAVCDSLLQAELEMLERVDSGHPPDPLDEAEARARWFATVPGKAVEATAEVALALVRRATAAKVKAIAEKVMAESALVLLRHAQDAESITHDFGSGTVPVCTLKANRVFDAAEFARRFPLLYSECQAFVPSMARERDRKAYESCMRSPSGPESSRVIRTTKQFDAALAKLLSGQPATSLVPELSQLTGGTDES